MAQGQYYTRQQQNVLAQRRIGQRAAEVARKKAEEERIKNDPRRIKLAELQAARTAKYARIDADIKQNLAAIEEYKKAQAAGTANRDRGRRLTKEWKALREQRDDVRRDYFEEIRTVERAIAKDISIKAQEGKQRDSRSRRRAKFAQRDALTEKFGTEVYSEMSPEARDYAYAQIQGRTTPTPNTARAKDRYNREQERYVQVGKQIVSDLNASYARVQARRAGAGAPKREDYGSSLAYNYAVREFNNTPRNTLTEASVSPSRGREAVAAFTAGITADRASADAMGLNERVGGAANLAYAAGQIAYIPARYYGPALAGRVIGGVAGAGASIGGAAGKYVGAAATLGGRYPAAVTVGSSVGKFVGGTAFATPPVLLGTYATTELQSAPVTAELGRRGIDQGAFRGAYAEALEDTGGLGELNPIFANRERFDANFGAALERRGITPSANLVQLGNQQRTASALGDAAGLVFAGAAANVLGARFLAQTGTGALYRTPIGTFSGGGFRAIGAAGILEGQVSSYGQNVARFEPLDHKRALIGGAFGGVSAGLLGGFVAGTAAAGQRSASSFYEGVGFAADPSEFGSDVLTASNPMGNARFSGVFATNAPPLSSFQGGSRELQPTLTDDFGIVPPVQPNKPSSTRGRPRGSNPFVYSNPAPQSQPQPLVDIPPAPQPQPVVPVSSNPSTNPFVPVNPAPSVPVAPAPFVPVAPQPVVPSQPNPIVDVPVTKLFVPGLGAGKRLYGRKKGGFGAGYRKATYTPSFAALELGIGASKISGKRSFSGFEIRPFLSPAKKKKKKGKTTRGKKRGSRKPLFSLGASPV